MPDQPAGQTIDMGVLVPDGHSGAAAEDGRRALASREMHLSGFVEHGWTTERAEQFAALTIDTRRRGGSICSFRGTDDTLAGWKEDLSHGLHAERFRRRNMAVAYTAGQWRGSIPG